MKSINQTFFVLTICCLILSSIQVLSKVKKLPYPSIKETKVEGMVYVPKGEFWMGSKNKRDRIYFLDESPYHKVYLDAYYIDKFEVTVAEYTECAKAGKCKVPDDSLGNWGKPDKIDHPINDLDWYQAKSYCEWAGKRLPKEAEWEKAARGTDGRDYPWGNNWNPKLLNSNNLVDGYDRTSPVGSFPGGASPFGAMDMSGNVEEWVSDWYDSEYYSKSPFRNPEGPSIGKFRVKRGGSFYDYESFPRTTSRLGHSPTSKWYGTGVRCAMDAKSKEENNL